MLFQIVLLIGFGCLITLLLLVLFEPGLPYRVVDGGLVSDAADFVSLLGVLVDSEVKQAQAADVLTNGAEFYEAELEAIRGSCRSVHIETFIFHPSAIADRFVAELVECARRGVSVRVVVDAIGSFPTPDSYFDALRQAGGESVGISPFAGTP